MMQGVAADGSDFAQGFAGAVWFDIVPRSAVRPELPPHVLLHAGPPFRGAPPAPVVNAAVQALMFEALAADEAGARDLLARGDAVLRPAQDHGIVTPLAQVVSASMLLGAVKHHAQVLYGALLEGSAPALRFGSTAPECRARLAALNVCMTESVAACVRRTPVALDDVIRRAVASGDECHSRTASANEELVSRIEGLDRDVAAGLRAVPAFVLPILMAAAAAAVRHHQGAIEAMGGNGVDFGVRRRGESTWRQMPAKAPVGESFPARAAAVRGPALCRPAVRGPAVPLPAIGDSVLIDFCGLGGQVDAPALRSALLDPANGMIDPARIAAGAGSATPAFNLAILDSAGELGLIGRGVFDPPPELFA